MIDIDGSGSINANEIKEIVCADQNINEKVWVDMV